MSNYVLIFHPAKNRRETAAFVKWSADVSTCIHSECSVRSSKSIIRTRSPGSQIERGHSVSQTV
jgi:hypothetical protein